MNAMLAGCGLVWLLLAVAAPAGARTWRIDAARSALAFTARCQGIRTDGRFARFAADVAYDPRDVARSRFAVSVDLASLDTGDAAHDRVALRAGVLDARRFPRAYFASTEFRVVDGRVTALGELMLHGVVRPVVLAVRFTPRGDAGTLEVTTQLRPQDFGVGCGPAGSGDAVSVRGRLWLEPTR